MRENKTRGGEIRTLVVGRRPENEGGSEIPLAKICSSTSRLEHCLDELQYRKGKNNVF